VRTNRIAPEPIEIDPLAVVQLQLTLNSGLHHDLLYAQTEVRMTVEHRSETLAA
jgi:hypothetical protein